MHAALQAYRFRERETVTEKVTIEREKELAGVYPSRRKCFLRYSRQCGQQYGCQHPTYYRYVGTEQTSWNVGGGISIPFEKLFDLRGGIKRQRIQVDIAELRKQEAYETLKIQIAHLYVQILSNIETLQRSAENIALYKGASAVAEQEYRNRRTSIHDVAKTKEQEFAANQDFALLRSTINDQLLTLEIISHTPILTIQGEKDVQETTIQEQEENKRQSKKKDKKE